MVFWNVNILKSPLYCVHFKLSWNGSPSLVPVSYNMKWRHWSVYFVTNTWDIWSCWNTWFTWLSVAVWSGWYDTQSGVAYVICNVFVSRCEFLVRCYWCSSRVFLSDGGCHCKASWDYVPLCRVNLCMDGMYRCFWYCRDLWCNGQYMTKDGGRNLFWKYEDGDPSGLASPTWICGRSPAGFGGSILPGAWMSVCCLCCVLRQRSVRLADHSSSSPTDYGVSMCVIYKPQEWGPRTPVGTLSHQEN